MYKCEKCQKSEGNLQNVILAGSYRATLCNLCLNAWHKALHASEVYTAWDQTYLAMSVFALDATAGKATPHDLIRQVADERRAALEAVFNFTESWMAEPIAPIAGARDE